MVSAQRVDASSNSSPSARSRPPSLPPAGQRSKPSKNGISAGAAITITRKAVHCDAADKGKIVQPAISARTHIGAVRLRRRLSSILNRPVIGTAAMGPRPKPNIHCNSCQSPRAQRWWRREATS